ncbi:MAG: hypothetical protein AAB546_02110, partial [Patescibacteria group bacterium]
MASSKKSSSQVINFQTLVVVLLIMVLIVTGFYFLSNYIKTTNQEVFNGEYVSEANVDLLTTKLPAQFPSDFPIPPSSVLVSSWLNEDKENLGVSVIWISSETFESL